MKKYISLFCILSILTAVFINPTVATTGMQGYAVYRDGVFVIQWHAAVMDKASSSDIYPVVHAPGSGENVQFGWWDDFMNNKTFKGYYRPKSQTLTSAKRDAVTATARSLAADFISYTLDEQMDYPVNNNTDNKIIVGISDITKMRCDGVVEYCYEYNNIRIYGNDTYWDISRWGNNYKNVHNGIAITPKSQAQNYMTLITSTP